MAKHSTRKKTGKKTETAPITWSQAQTLLKCLVADGEFNTALMFAAGFYFGLRIGDVLRLRWSHITADRFQIQEQKTGKTRIVDVHRDFKKIVDQALADRPQPDGERYVFVSQRSGADRSKPISVVAANKRIKKAFEHCGITAQNPSSHTLRKTFGRRVWENNDQSEAALILLSQIFNHRDIATTRRYIGLTQQRISSAYLSL